MGSGQLGVAYVDRAPSRQRPREAIKSFSEAIVNSLALLDVPASFQGKNDVEVRGRKIAGLGVHVDGEGAMILHASILADLDISQMLRLLRIPAAKLGRHGAAAVADRLTTVTEQTGRLVARYHAIVGV